MRPGERARRRWWAGFGLALFAVAASDAGIAWWALHPPAIDPARLRVPEPEATPAAEAREGEAGEPQAWQVRLWQPLRDAPPPQPPPPTPPKAALFAILDRDGTKVAALELEPDAGLVYLREGETRGGLTVDEIAGASVRVRWKGGDHTLELDR